MLLPIQFQRDLQGLRQLGLWAIQGQSPPGPAPNSYSLYPEAFRSFREHQLLDHGWGWGRPEGGARKPCPAWGIVLGGCVGRSRKVSEPPLLGFLPREEASWKTRHGPQPFL